MSDNEIKLGNVAEIVATMVVKRLMDPSIHPGHPEGLIGVVCIGNAVKAVMNELVIKVKVGSVPVSVYVEGLVLDTHYQVGKTPPPEPGFGNDDSR